MKAAILTDTTKCIGCHECVLGCRKVNHLQPDAPRRWDLDDGLSARSWTSIVEGPGRAFVRKQCRHCLEPACVSACPVGALAKSETGAVVYDSGKCMGCRYCMMACPYGIPRYDWEYTTPFVRKCTLCDDRVRAGGQPACTEACPTKATVFGDRDVLVATARQRLHENPGAYTNRLWGEFDAGGTSVFYISNADLSFLTPGTPLGTTSLPSTTAVAMESVPFVFTGVIAGMASLGWIIERRTKRQGEPGDE